MSHNGPLMDLIGQGMSHTLSHSYEPRVVRKGFLDSTLRNKILFILNKMERIHFIIQIKYYRSNSVQTATLFKNDVAVCTLLDL